jgi:predicted chitinase
MGRCPPNILMPEESPPRLFISYSRKDDHLRKQLMDCLTNLKFSGVIDIWYDREISAGLDWANEIDSHLEEADIILCLVSSGFLASPYCTGIELKRALELHKSGQARLIPVVLKPVDWEGTALQRLQALPTDGKPISKWSNTDEALVSVSQGIRKVAKELAAQPARRARRSLAAQPMAPAIPAPLSVPERISAEQGERIFDRSISAQQLADLNACLERFEIDTPARIAPFLALIARETAGLRFLEEGGDGTPYEGRADLGNTEPGDGTRYKGAGGLMITGRANYASLSRCIGDPQVMEGHAYVARLYPFTSAGYWWKNNRLNEAMDSGEGNGHIVRRMLGTVSETAVAQLDRFCATTLAVIGPSPVETKQTDSKLLEDVPYFSQRQTRSDQGQRMAFSSSCAMLAAALRPEDLSGGQDQYLGIVNRYGDTTDVSAQLQALQSLGIEARLLTTADFSGLEEQINRGIPVPCGFYHKGPLNAPSGAGHWLCVVGFTPKSVIVNDPAGALDLIEGVYADPNGQGLHYSRKEFGRRWMVDGPNNYAPGHGWAIIAH